MGGNKKRSGQSQRVNKPKKSHKSNSPRRSECAKKPRMSHNSPRNSKKSQNSSSSSLCQIFGKCGGCDYLDIDYKEQLQNKQTAIYELFSDFASDDEFLKIKGMDDPYHYRDKVISPFVFGKKLPSGKRQILTGMYEAGTHRVLQNDACLLENEIAQKTIRVIRQIMLKYDMQPYDEDRGTGFIRHAVIRVGHETDEVLLTIVTNAREFPHSKSFCRKIIEKVPEITTIVQNVNTRQTNVILGDEEHVLYGPGFILDTLCGLSFRISSHSFYQVNSAQTEALYRSAMELAHPEDGGIFIDAYCGTGTIGLVAASMGAEYVVGVDSVASSIRDARANAKHNGIVNAEFECIDATEFLQKMVADNAFGEKTSEEGLTILMDPPRAGSTDEFLDAAAMLNPKRIVYISCNPKTQARDVKFLIDRGFSIEAIQSVDMFPHTKHVENIVSLVKL